MSVDRDRLLRDALARIEELEQGVLRQHEPIAVIGWGLRAPGADGPDELWDRLLEGVGSVGPLEDERWAPLPAVVDSAGWVGHLREFDAEFFGISAHEAASIDPQQRLLLEVTWEALESAGIPGRRAPERTGVFVGVSNIDYREAMVLTGDPDRFFSSGSTASTASGRLAYFFGTRGPALSVDTACSSSLVAVDLAVRHLRDGSCDLALAGGVNRMVTPHESLSLTRASMLSPSGTCHPFSAHADGYVRGEGAGIVVLKRLADVGGHDRVLGLLLGSATNQDGRSSGLTVPHGPSQQAVIRAALRNAGVAPDEVGYVEAHGTGTKVGDLIEIQALSSVFAGRRYPLLVGSVKSSIGHLEASAGVAGLIKTLQAVRHGTVPATLHHEPPLDDVDWVGGPVRVPTGVEPWPGEGRRVAGVSSFGFSGTNVHVVVAAPPDPDNRLCRPEDVASGAPAAPPLVLPLSARHPRALRQLSQRWERVLLAHPDQASVLVATAALGRTHFPLRRCVVSDSAAGLAQQLRERASEPVGRPKPRPRIAFLFTGQGSQSPGMAAELHRCVPVFRDAVEACLASSGDAAEALRQVLLTPDERVHETELTQPALFIMEYALAELWKSWGVEPDVVLGHSVGEYVAACVAGAMSPEATLRLLVVRGRLMQACPPGVMYSVGLGGTDAAELVDRVADLPSSCVAAFNTPTSTVLSGLEDELAPLLADLTERGVRLRRLTVSRAFHSPLLRPMAAELAEASSGLTASAPLIPVVSNVTGLVHDGVISADYWARHALEPVRFQQCLETTRALDVDILVEIAPATVLLDMVEEVCRDLVRVPSLARGKLGLASAMAGLATAYEGGVNPDWEAVFGDQRAPTADAPSYPFQRRTHWSAANTLDLTHRPVVLRDRAGLGLLTTAQVAAPSCATAPKGWPGKALVVGSAAAEVASALRCTQVPVEVVEPAAIDGVPLDLGEHDDLWLAICDDGSVTSAVSASATVVRVVRTLVSRAGSTTSASSPRRLVVAVLGPGTPQPTPAERAVEAVLRTAAAELGPASYAAFSWQTGGKPVLSRVALDAATGWVSLVRMSSGGVATTAVLRRGPTLPEVGQAAGAVVVTGGTGALGRRVVEALIEAGHPRVVVLARREPDDVAASLAGMRAAGHDVRLVRGDVADRDAVRRAFTEASDGLPLRGVVHVAGTDHRAPLLDLDEASFGQAAVTARGAEVLVEAMRGHPELPLVAFSSLAAHLPTRLAAAYAAANAALEAVVVARRAAGGAGVAVAWGPWAGGGMASGEEAAHASTGLGMLDPEAAARATVAILHNAWSLPAQLVYADADWDIVRPSLAPVADVVLRDLASPTPAGSGVAVEGPRDEGDDDRPEVERPRDQDDLRDHVEHIVRSLLGVTSAVDLDTGFFDLGFDSLLVVELRGRLQRALGVDLPATVAFRHPTPRALIEQLASDLGLDRHEGPGRGRRGFADASLSTSAVQSNTDLDVVLARIDARYHELDQPG